MLAAMLSAAGLRTTRRRKHRCESLIDAVVAEQPYDVLAVELGAQHLSFVTSVRLRPPPA